MLTKKKLHNMYVRNMAVCLCVILAVCLCDARTFDFKTIGSKTAAVRGSFGKVEKNKNKICQMKVGPALGNDDMSSMEIRAATVFKNSASKVTSINDVTSMYFEPINTSKAIYFSIASGFAAREWQVAGCIVELWQNGKLVQHWSNVYGNGGQQSLSGKVDQMKLGKNGWRTYGDEFPNATEIYATDKKGERVNLDEVLAEFREESEGAQKQSSDRTKAAANASRDEKNGKKSVPKPVSLVFDVDKLNSELKVKSFCGVKFGEVFEHITPSSGRGARLAQKFRCFDSATRWGSRTRNRVARIELNGTVDQLEMDGAQKEVEAVARLVGKKFGVTFSSVELRSSRCSCSCSNDDLEINISASVFDGSARFTLSFLNKQVDKQNEQYRALLPKKKLTMSSDEGADVL